MSDFKERVNSLEKMIQEANHVLLFSGAGVSTESGMKDFRSENGLYNEKDELYKAYRPEYLLSKECLCHNPKIFYSYYKNKMDARRYEPNVTHLYFAELEKMGKKVSVVTQNIDGLHTKAGNSTVYEIHGTTMRNYCVKCKKQFDSNYVFDSEESIPRCDECGMSGMVRPDITLYGEQLQHFKEATRAMEEADLCIVAGTSLNVYPAANLVSDCSGKLVVVNREMTLADTFADLVFRESLGEVFEELTKRLNEQSLDLNR